MPVLVLILILIPIPKQISRTQFQFITGFYKKLRTGFQKIRPSSSSVFSNQKQNQQFVALQTVYVPNIGCYLF
jgi:hypothetical protein